VAPLCNNASQSALLIADASEHLAHVVMGSAKLGESRVTFCASLGIGSRPLHVKIPPVEFCIAQGVHSLVDGVVSSSVAITQVSEASAVEVDSGDSCHGDQ
jgi:hypothetical protein